MSKKILATNEKKLSLSVTGTRRTNAISNSAIETFKKILGYLKIGEFNHGDCKGVDQKLHEIIVGLRDDKNNVSKSGIDINIYPPTDSTHRAYCQGGFMNKKQGYVERNIKLVKLCHLLIALPRSNNRQLSNKSYGGTLQTIDYAFEKNKPIIVICPSGQIEYFNIDVSQWTDIEKKDIEDETKRYINPVKMSNKRNSGNKNYFYGKYNNKVVD